MMPFFYMNPTFEPHYNQGYEARPINYDALYEEAFKQIGERTIITLSTERVSIDGGMRVMWNRPLALRIKHNPNAVKEFCPERFADALQQSLGSEVLIHEEIARAKEPRFVERTISNYFTPLSHREVFAPIEKMKADIREAGGWDAYWAKKNTEAMDTIQSRYDALPLHMKHPQDRFNHWMGVITQQARAYDNFLASALGFEPTEHSDAPPYIPTTPTSKPKPCVDFGFEPTEASE